ncbi:MAG: 2,3-bisphosphoglycerate-independent phosphoglycerate mutase, partial [Solirubrobacteraceae bacterium]
MTLPAGPDGLPAGSVCLVILDGWGLAEPGPGNAVSLARTPVFDELWEAYPHTTLTACGKAVGLPDGQMGNSEVGHLNLGAGSVVRQDLVRINDAIADGAFAANPVLRAALSGLGRVHLIGLVSDGGVHSSLEHLRALIACASDPSVSGLSVSGQAEGGAAAGEGGHRDVIVHAFTDGRDTLPHAGAGFLAQLDATEGARVGSVVGRYWAMDRDRRWDRVQRAYELLVHGRGGGDGGRAPYHAATGEEAVRAAYERGETDEFVEPTLVGGEDARIRPGDSVIAFNFRPDRMRELTRALAEPGFAEFDRDGGGPLWRYATLTEYEEGWPYPVAFPPERPRTTLGIALAQAGARQLHVAETEKYPHVTYFFNGGEEAPLE